MSEKSTPPKLPKKPASKDNLVNQNALPGWPGYRTRKGRSGYDPIDTDIEAAHISGSFLQKLFTVRLKIRNPLYLFLTGVLGLALVSPLILAIFELLNGNLSSSNSWILILVAGVVGLALLSNFVKNLIRVIK